MSGERRHERKLLKVNAEAISEAKDVAGKAIGKYGLLYITTIVLVGVSASFFLDENKIAAVIGLVSAALTGLIAMLSGVAEAEKDGQSPEVDYIKQLIDKLDSDHMVVDVSEGRVKVERGRNIVNAELPKTELNEG